MLYSYLLSIFIVEKIPLVWSTLSILTPLQASMTSCVDPNSFMLKVVTGAPEARIRVNELAFRSNRKKI